MTAARYDGAMSAAEEPTTSFPGFPFAAHAALTAMGEALRDAEAAGPEAPLREAEPPSPEDALAALLLLRLLRERLAEWEPSLVTAARDAGASWAQLAHPMGVASRQAAERRFLRSRPGAPGTTGEQRVQAERDRRAAGRVASHWARDNAADLRRLAGRISALGGLPEDVCEPIDAAMGAPDAVALLQPLREARGHLDEDHTELAAQYDALLAPEGTHRFEDGAGR